ncbi:prolipoprotein diacylglyceryl transferase [Hymenobacter cellulosivorans]|uniref:Phosphatidylglycerol--prolipoprotein diacylglyceryl transferase n=1 Tax=Hymenobacter cellulosivorans TaxID=2932249 RepID=A0ABY4F723_9BACT|nr:prolipoprotein diacylglyceryl transferase [Hymenobacter cellulosivorans]UOQ52333.1 prolipoprotein diacylglyceryl transferase [Hymenobacter cellulosivorans]
MSLLAALTWTVSPLIYDFGFFQLTWYGLLFASGFVLGSFILTRIYQAEQVAPKWVDVITLYMLGGTVLGARLGHCLFYDWDYYSQHPLEIFFVFPWAGLASHGATLGILLATWLFSRRHRFDYLWVLDRIVLVVAVGGACIRLGNLLNSEIVGRPAQVPWALVFPRDQDHLQAPTFPVPAGAVLVQPGHGPRWQKLELLPADKPAPAGALMAVPRHPTQVYEALFCVLLFVLLYRLWQKYREKTPRGLLFGLFVTLLFSFRFAVEFLKEDQVAFEQGLVLNMGQLLSLPLIGLGVWVLLRAGKRAANPSGPTPREADSSVAVVLSPESSPA